MALFEESAQALPVSLAQRELGLRTQAFVSHHHFTASLARKLSVESVLTGHGGCVNRLSWNHDGTLLASASDDRQVILWPYPDNGRAPLALRTQHRANLFGVQFLPCSNDARVVSCAMDHTVQLHDLGDARPSSRRSATAGSSGGAAAATAAAGQQRQGAQRGGRPVRATAGADMRTTTPHTVVHHCHSARVKDVRVEPGNAYNYWSAGEDGFVRQFDTRCSNQSTFESANVLLEVRERGGSLELKSLDINKVQPHYMAVAASDSQIRLYDRRKLAPYAPGRSAAMPEPVLRLQPPHLGLGSRQSNLRSTTAHITYCHFSNRGDRIVATYHGDHAYSFDVTSIGSLHAAFARPPSAAGAAAAGGSPQHRPKNAAVQEPSGSPRTPVQRRHYPQSPSCAEDDPRVNSASEASTSGRRDGSPVHADLFPPAVEQLRLAGNRAAFDERWTAALDHYSEALRRLHADGADHQQRLRRGFGSRARSPPAAASAAAGGGAAAAVALLLSHRAEAFLGRGRPGDALWALRECDAALEVDPGCARAALKRVHALRALGQLQCALAELDNYARQHGGGGGGMSRPTSGEWRTLQEQLQAAVAERRRVHDARQQQARHRRQLRQGAEAALAQEGRKVGRRSLARDATEDIITRLHSDRQPPPSSTSPATPVPVSAAASAPTTSAPVSVRTASPAPPSPVPARAVNGHSKSAAPCDDVTPTSSDAPCPASVARPPPPAVVDMGCDVQASQNGVAVPVCVGDAARATTFLSNNGEAAAREVLPAVGEHDHGFVHVSCNGDAAAAHGTSTEGPADADAAAMAETQATAQGASSSQSSPSPSQAPEVQAASGSGDAQGMEEAEVEQSSAAVGRGGGDFGGYGTDDEEYDEEGDGPGSSTGGEDDEEDEESEEEEEDDEDFDEDDDPDLHEPLLAFYGLGTSPSRRAAYKHMVGGTLNPGRPSSWSGNRPSLWRDSVSGRRLMQRYMGQCNTQTDIKEAVFVGSGDLLVAAGSDDGRVFIYDADTGVPVRVLEADEDVANCVQCHPSIAVLATSGIENVVRLWSPVEDAPPQRAEELADIIERNQERMREGARPLRATALHALAENPQLWQMLIANRLFGRGAGAQAAGAAAAATDGTPAAGDDDAGDDDDDEGDEEGRAEVSCRMN